MNLSTHAAPALSDDEVAPIRELSHRGSRSGGVEIALSVLHVIEHFPYKLDHSAMKRGFF